MLCVWRWSWEHRRSHHLEDDKFVPAAPSREVTLSALDILAWPCGICVSRTYAEIFMYSQEELEQLEAEALGLVTDAAGKQPASGDKRTLADVWHPYNPYRARLDINPDFLTSDREGARTRQ